MTTGEGRQVYPILHRDSTSASVFSRAAIGPRDPAAPLLRETDVTSVGTCGKRRSSERSGRTQPLPTLNFRLLHGAIAQLGERLNGIQEVTGSIPVSSTEIAQLFFRKRWFWVHGCILSANSVVRPGSKLGVKRPTSRLIAFQHLKRSHEAGWARGSDRASTLRVRETCRTRVIRTMH